MKLRVAALALALWLPSISMAAPEGFLTLPDFRALEKKAVDSVNISLDPWMLRSLAAFVDEKDGDGAATKRLLGEISSLQVRNFEFDTEFAYPMAEVDAIRQQLTGPGWTRLMTANDRKAGQDVDIYLMMEGNRTKAFALIVSEAKQLTIINVVGSISLEDLPALERQLNLRNLAMPRAML